MTRALIITNPAAARMLGMFLGMSFVSCFLGFFLWFALITKPLWNHRAKKLRQ